MNLNAPPGPAFHRLPEELLTEIAKQVHMPWPFPFIELQDLRLTSRKFAYLDFIQKLMFHTLRFVVSLDNVERIEHSDFSHIKHFVKCIIFKFDKLGWRDHFNSLVNINRKWENRNDFTISTQKLLHDSRLESAWSSALGKLPHVDDFRIGLNACQYSCHTEVNIHYCEYYRWIFPKPIGERLAAVVRRSLSNAGVKSARKLSVRNMFHGTCEKSNRPGLIMPTLGGLEELIIDFGFPLRHMHDVADNVTLALVKCASTLKKLELDFHEREVPWPQYGETLTLPKLEHLDVTDIKAEPSALASILSNAANLNYVSLKNVSLGEKKCRWKPVWEAIRNHQNRMTILLDIKVIEGRYRTVRLQLDYHTSQPAGQCEGTEAAIEQISVRLRNYLSNNGDWDKVLEMAFNSDGWVTW